MFLSLGMFVLALLIGVFSSRQDPDFANLVLGEYYVNMTLDNIENGDPMAVYSGGDEVISFFRILLNNAYIDITVFAAGLLFSVFSIFILMKNGIMVGTFQYFFYAHGGFTTSLMTIWLHGTIEISTIVLAGGAGLMAGRGLLIPGTYNRLQAFRISSLRGVKLLLAILPFTVLAAFIESFITGMSIPNLVKLIVVGASLLLMIIYFVVYPYRKFARKDKVHKEEEDQIPYRKIREVQLDKIKGVGALVLDTVNVYRKNFGKIMIVAILGAVCYQAVVLNYFESYKELFVFGSEFEPVDELSSFFDVEAISLKSYIYRADPQFFMFISALFSAVAAATIMLVSRNKLWSNRFKRLWLMPLVGGAVFYLTFQLFKPYFLLTNLFMGVFWLTAAGIAVSWVYRKGEGTRNIGSDIKILFKGFGKLLGLGLIFTIFAFLSILIASAPVSFFNQIFIQEMILISPEMMKSLSDIFMVSMNLIVLFAVVPLFGIGALLWRDSMIEQCYAVNLKEEVKRDFNLNIEW